MRIKVSRTSKGCEYRDRVLNISRSTLGKGSEDPPRRIQKEGTGLIFAKDEYERRCANRLFAYGQQTRPRQCFGQEALNIALPKMRVALRATSPSADVAERGLLYQNVAPAQQLIISLVHTRKDFLA